MPGTHRCSIGLWRPDQLERLRERLDALPPAARAELPHVPMLPDFERAERIGESWSYPQSRAAPYRLRGGPDAPGGCLSACRETETGGEFKATRTFTDAV